MKLFRTLVLLTLGLAMAGFGVCALCGGVIGTQALVDSPHGGGRDIAWLAYGCSAVGLLIAWGCWRAFRNLRQRAAGADAAARPVAAPPPDGR